MSTEVFDPAESQVETSFALPPDARARLVGLAEAVDQRVAADEALTNSAVGFGLGIVVGTAKTNPDGTYADLRPWLDVLIDVVHYVDNGEVGPALAAFVPDLTADTPGE